jgi:carboxyl-terminal processing protease
LREKSIIYQFALQYADRNREKLTKLNNADAIEKELSKADLVADLVRFAEKTGIKTKTDQLKTSLHIIDNELKAYIARNIIDNDGFYPIIFKTDKEVIAAIDELNKEKNE